MASGFRRNVAEIRVKLSRIPDSHENRLVPALYCQHNDHQDTLDKVNNAYFQIIEYLEANQANFDVDALKYLSTVTSLIDKLIDENCRDHHVCLRYIFQRFLRRERYLVRREGVRQLLKLSPKLFDDIWLDLLTEVLNDCSLYENANCQDAPDIVTKLADLFLRAQRGTRPDLISKFIEAASKQTWKGVPLFYITEALKVTTIDAVGNRNVWSEREIEDVARLTGEVKSVYTRVIDNGIINNLKILIEHYLKKPINLHLLNRLPLDSLMVSSTVSKCYWLNYIGESAMDEYIGDICQRLLDSEDDNNSIDISKFACAIQRHRELHKNTNRYFDTLTMPIGLAHLTNVFDVLIAAAENPHPNPKVCFRAFSLIANLFRHIVVDSYGNYESWFVQLITPYWPFIRKFIKINTGVKHWFTRYEEAPIFLVNLRIIMKYMDDEESTKRLDRQFVEKILLKNNIGVLDHWYLVELIWIYWPNCAQSVEHFLTVNEGAIDDVRYTRGVIETVLHRLKCLTSIAKSKLPFVTESCKLMVQLVRNLMILSDGIDSKVWRLIMYLVELGRDPVLVCAMRIFNDVLKNEYFESVQAREEAMHGMLELLSLYQWDSCIENHEARKDTPLKSFFPIQNITVNDNDAITKKIERLIKMCLKDPMVGLRFTTYLGYLDSSPLCGYFVLTVLFCIRESSTLEERVDLQTKKYIDFVSGYAFKHHEDRILDIFLEIRVEIIEFCLQSTWAEDIIPMLSDIIQEYSKKPTPKNTPNHRMKLRSMQILLNIPTIFVKIDETEYKQKFFEALLSTIVYYDEERCVRLMQEWFVILVFYYDSNITDEKIWQLLSQAKFFSENQNSIQSLASIVYHVVQFMPAQRRGSLIIGAVSQFYPCCSDDLYPPNVRLHCQVILKKLIDMLPAANLSEDHQNKKEFIRQCLSQPDVVKAATALSEDFYFTSFNPLGNLDFQTIFYELPKFFDITPEELIEPQIFRDRCGYRMHGAHNIFHYNRLGYLQPSVDNSWIQENFYCGPRTLRQYTSENILDEFNNMRSRKWQ